MRIGSLDQWTCSRAAPFRIYFTGGLQLPRQTERMIVWDLVSSRQTNASLRFRRSAFVGHPIVQRNRRPEAVLDARRAAMEGVFLTMSAWLFTAAVLHSQDRHPLKQLLLLSSQNARRELPTGRQWPMSSSTPLIESGCPDRERYRPMVESQSSPPILRLWIHATRLMAASWCVVRTRAGASSASSLLLETLPGREETDWRIGRTDF